MANISWQVHYGRYIESNKHGHILTNFQRQKLSIAASESACCNASLVAPPWPLVGPLVYRTKPFEGSLEAPGDPMGIPPCGRPWALVGPLGWALVDRALVGPCHYIYIYMYILM